MNIGVFDSGLGGLTILKQFIKILPEYNYIYLGDNARVPYGNHSSEIIYRFTTESLEFLIKKNCKLIIIACNTATSASLKRIQHEFIPQKYPHIKILGIIKPIVEQANELKFNKIGVIGTFNTITAHAFKKEIKKLNSEIKVYEKACPLLVPIIESGESDWIGTNLILNKYLIPLNKNKIQCLILGCTHFNLIKKQISKVLNNIKILSEDKITAVKLRYYLAKHPEIDNQLIKNKLKKIYLTDSNSFYQKQIRLFLGKINKDIQIKQIFLQ